MARQITLQPMDFRSQDDVLDGDYSSPPMDDIQPAQPQTVEDTAPTVDVAPQVAEGATQASPRASYVYPDSPGQPGAAAGGGQDPVAAYLASRISGRTDPKLEQAQREDKVKRIMDSLGGVGAGVGNTLVGNAQAFANAIAGKGYTSPLLEQAAQERAHAFDPKPNSDSAVSRYLQAKRAQQDDANMDLTQAKAAIDMKKAMAGQDPNSLEERKLQLQIEEAERKKAADAYREAHNETTDSQKDRFLNQGDDRNSLAKQKHEDDEKFRVYQQKIGWASLDARQKMLALGEFKAQLRADSVAQGQERLDRDLGDRTVAGVDGTFSKFQAKDLQGMSGNTSAALGMMQRLKDLRGQLTLNGVLPTDAKAQFEAAYHALSPVLNGAEFKTAWNKAHGENFTEQIRSPEDLAGWLNKDYFAAQVDEVMDALKANFGHRVEGAGGHVRANEPLTGPQTAGRPIGFKKGSAAGRVVSKPSAPVTVRRKSDGVTRTLAADSAQKYLADPAYEVVK